MNQDELFPSVSPEDIAPKDINADGDDKDDFPPLPTNYGRFIVSQRMLAEQPSKMMQHIALDREITVRQFYCIVRTLCGITIKAVFREEDESYNVCNECKYQRIHRRVIIR